MKNKFSILIKPIMTEKAYSLSNDSIVVFQVVKSADKLSVKNAFESVFGAKVSDVRLLNRKGKVKRFKGHLGKRSDMKIAYIRLAAGQDFDLASGLVGGA